ncbi:ribonuclease E activity regulator RraA [Pseudoclavibacter caeni]|jgi:regulator of ribonuclease activity A|uniref:4-hydroxy-4-methyl-2-oxoglutarate aldolase n=1 Tax=Pseudoclavibacter caeni TaxID=908846 RepID=A0A7C8BS01_9MICO|nr:ribonuclease E activity regulator RraA [Pseudoclavibacter caeni]KAB1633018.1 ribonuclease E activity regulator RraA [Pseudoclavibacter caeni]NYJ97000.1 regulator of ribonuclease activity A [Pseudoclavibacter caeni]
MTEKTDDVLTADLADDRTRPLRSVSSQLRSFGGRPRAHGPVHTLQLFEDNSLLREALSQPGEGRVLVVDAGGSLRRAVMGGDLAELAARSGWAGVLIAGAVRDTVEIAHAAVHVKALGSQPVPTVKRGQGVAGEPIRFLDVEVRPGDWVASDEDGVVFLDQAPER